MAGRFFSACTPSGVVTRQTLQKEHVTSLVAQASLPAGNGGTERLSQKGEKGQNRAMFLCGGRSQTRPYTCSPHHPAVRAPGPGFGFVP
jgi:hypothetical protein